MKLHELSGRAGSRKARKRIGRGIGSGKGKTGGRGGKGQTARSGVRIKGFEGGQMPLHRRLPKRGFSNTKFALKLNEINLGRLQEAIDAGKLDTAGKIDADALVKAGILRRAKDGVRLLGSGELKAKIARFGLWRVEVGAWPPWRRPAARSKSRAQAGGGRSGRLTRRRAGLVPGVHDFYLSRGANGREQRGRSA